MKSFYGRGGDKKGQITIFIIIAVLIVSMAVLLYTFVPRTISEVDLRGSNPQGFIEICLEDDIENVIEKISLQGGSIEPENYFTYNGINIEYLCYTNENYKLCVVQQPLLKQHVESEIKKEIEGQAEVCFNQMKTSFENQGYGVELQNGITRVELLPKRVIVSFDNYQLTLTKGETEIHDSFDIILNNNLYELTSITKSIIEWETTLGNADPRIYMTYYSDLKVEKNLRDEGTRIYVLTDKNTGNKFQFASRSNFRPAGF